MKHLTLLAAITGLLILQGCTSTEPENNKNNSGFTAQPLKLASPSPTPNPNDNSPSGLLAQAKIYFNGAMSDYDAAEAKKRLDQIPKSAKEYQEAQRLLAQIKSRPAASSVATPDAEAEKTIETFGEGTKVVGQDIKPGTYRTRTRAPGCYWTRLAGFSGELGDILANGNESGPVIVTIKPSDKGFESHRCGTWTTDLSPITTSPDAPFDDGYYFVGTDIAPGTWQADSPESCYWARLGGFTGGLGDIIANANQRGIITISKKDKGFKSSKCGSWTKIK